MDPGMAGELEAINRPPVGDLSIAPQE